MVKIKKQLCNGFTLIELIIATSLLMMVMFSGYYGYSLYSQKWQKRVQVFWKGTEQAIAIDSLNKMLSSAIPYIVKGKDDKACVYFKGTSTDVSFISYSAIFSDEPSLIRLHTENIANTNHVKLIYQEQSIKNSLVLKIDHHAQWQHQIVLLKNITDFNISYFGWESFEKAISKANSSSVFTKEGRNWYTTHQSNISRLLPDSIKISFIDNHGLTNFQIALPQHSLNNLLAYIRVDA